MRCYNCRKEITEQEARTVYEFETGNVVQEVGFVEHPNLPFAGASPDGLVGDDGIVEIKCPNTATHVETILSGDVPQKYYLQLQWQLECSGRQWCDYVSYDPRMRDQNYVLFVKRVERDQVCIDMLITDIMEAETELTNLLSELEAKRK